MNALYWIMHWKLLLLLAVSVLLKPVCFVARFWFSAQWSHIHVENFSSALDLYSRVVEALLVIISNHDHISLHKGKCCDIFLTLHIIKRTELFLSNSGFRISRRRMIRIILGFRLFGRIIIDPMLLYLYNENRRHLFGCSCIMKRRDTLFFLIM